MASVRSPGRFSAGTTPPPGVWRYLDRMADERGTGKFLGVPYDWRRPTLARTKERWWNPDEPRLLTPKVFGWGWDLNLARLLGRKPKH